MASYSNFDKVMSPAEFSLLTQIIPCASEYAYIRAPVGEEVRSLLRRGYLRAVDHNGKAVLQPTGAGKDAIIYNRRIARDVK